MGAFARAAAIRAVRTAAQAALGVVGAGTVDLVATDWQGVASVALGAAAVSVLTSIASGLPEAK